MLEWALNEKFELEYVEAANASLHKYFCPECRGIVVAKNHNFEGRTKAKHFAHANHSSTCPAAGESTLHINTKMFLYNKLTKSKEYTVYIKTRIGESIQYFSYNLLENVDDVQLEKRSLVNKYIPDISLYQEGKIIKAVEVVNTHEDTTLKINAYQAEAIKALILRVNPVVYKRLLRGSLPVFELHRKQTIATFLKSL